MEGGLDWKPLSLSPKDMDFIEAKNAAAREIALAIGVPPMLLGIPGDNTWSDLAALRVKFAGARVARLLRLDRRYREDQPRVPAGNPDGGQWTDDGGGISGTSDGRVRVAQAEGQAPLRRLHPDSTYEQGSAKLSIEHQRKQPTEALVESLKPGADSPLLVKPDGTIMQGNTRVKVLQERGYDVNSLPRTPYPTSGSGGGGMSGGSGGMRGPGDIGGLKPSPLVRPRRSDFLN